MIAHRPYPSDVTDPEWEFVLPYLCLLPEDAGQRVHNLRDVLDALRWLVRAGAPWRYLPKDFPPLGDGLPADPALARRRMLRGHGPRPPRRAPRRRRQGARADR